MANARKRTSAKTKAKSSTQLNDTTQRQEQKLNAKVARTVLAASTFAFVVFFAVLGGFNSTTSNTIWHPDHPGVVIIAQGRSGSSFLGSWFEASEEFLFFVEPCASPYTHRHVSTTGKSCGKILEEILHCDFKSVRPDLTKYQNTVTEEFDGWGNRSAIENCRKQAKVIKEIRIGPWGLKEDFSSFGDEAKVVVLLRDPRSIFASRLKNWIVPDSGENEVVDFSQDGPVGFNPSKRTGHPYAQSIKSLCMEQLEMYKIAKARGPKRAHIINYIALLTQPRKTAQDLFEYLEIPMSKAVHDHIENHITGNCKFLDKAFSVCRNYSDEERKRLTDLKWMKTLKEEQIEQIENYCSETLSVQGYKLYNDLISEQEN